MHVLIIKQIKSYISCFKVSKKILEFQYTAWNK